MNAQPQLTVARQTIKMVDCSQREMVEVKPWQADLDNVTKLIPFFWSGSLNKWITIPDYEAEDVAEEWLAQWAI